MQKSLLSNPLFSGLASNSCLIPLFSLTTKLRCRLSSIPVYEAVRWCASEFVTSSTTTFPTALPRSRCATARPTQVLKEMNGLIDLRSSAPPLPRLIRHAFSYQTLSTTSPSTWQFIGEPFSPHGASRGINGFQYIVIGRFSNRGSKTKPRQISFTSYRQMTSARSVAWPAQSPTMHQSANIVYISIRILTPFAQHARNAYRHRLMSYFTVLDTSLSILLLLIELAIGITISRGKTTFHAILPPSHSGISRTTYIEGGNFWNPSALCAYLAYAVRYASH